MSPIEESDLKRVLKSVSDVQADLKVLVAVLEEKEKTSKTLSGEKEKQCEKKEKRIVALENGVEKLGSAFLRFKTWVKAGVCFFGGRLVFDIIKFFVVNIGGK